MIRKASDTNEDVLMLQKLAKKTFYDTFAYENSEDRIPYFGFLFCFCKNTKKIGTDNAGFRQCAPPCAGSVPELRW